jgi:hypothetical protein
MNLYRFEGTSAQVLRRARFPERFAFAFVAR